MKYVFISHSHDNVDYANTTIHELERAGFIHWIDSEKIGLGDDWRQKIDGALNESFAVIVIMTPEAKDSEYVTYEWIYALGLGVKIIPLIFNPTKLHLKMQVMNYSDFANPRTRRWDLVMEELKAVQASSEVVSATSESQTPLKTKDPISTLMVDLASQNAKVRKSVIDTLRAYKVTEAVTDLIVILRNDSENEVRVAAANALGELGDNSAVPQLLIALASDENYDVRQAAAESLGELRDNRAVKGLSNAVRHDASNWVRTSAVEALGSIRDYEGFWVIESALDDQDSFVRNSAGWELAWWKDVDAIPKISEKFDQLSSYVQNELITQFSESEKPEALAAVEEWRRRQQN